MTTKATQGPWKWNPNDAEIWPTTGRRAPIATVFTAAQPDSEMSDVSSSFTEEESANAQLIAQAPELLRQRDELLAALKQTLDALYNETAGRDDSPWIESVKQQASAAIAQAAGEPVYATRQQGRDTITEQVSGRTMTDAEWEAHADQVVASTPQYRPVAKYRVSQAQEAAYHLAQESYFGHSLPQAEKGQS